MKTYVVGGAVRDELLGLAVTDRDWVVVGSTPEEMQRRGFKAVGRDFPVFLHPVTHEEYALARTERKSGRGYRGFTVYAAPEVTLEEDLRRRDLSINAMARDDNGTLIDPFGGERDLRSGVLRHVSEAFAEDPVRILRVARFAARFGFRVADETLVLMRAMVAQGEVEHLVAERAWQELARGLMEPAPARMFEVLDACGALASLLREVQALFAAPALRASWRASLERAAAAGAALTVRFALIGWFLPLRDGTALRALSERLRLPVEVRDLALLAQRCAARLRRASEEPPVALLELLKAADAFRRRERFEELLAVAGFAGTADAALERTRRSLAAAAAVDAGAIAAESGTGIAARIDAARERAIAAALA